MWGAIHFYKEPYENTNFGHFSANNNNNNGGGWRREGWLPISESTRLAHENLQKKVSVSVHRLSQFHHYKLSSSYQEETCPTLTSLNWPNPSTPSKRRQFTTPEGSYWASRGGWGRPGAGGGWWRAGAGWRARGYRCVVPIFCLRIVTLEILNNCEFVESLKRWNEH